MGFKGQFAQQQSGAADIRRGSLATILPRAALVWFLG